VARGRGAGRSRTYSATASGPSPETGDSEAALQEKRRSELLRESLAKLSPEHSEVIDLVYYHGKSVKEVAEIVGVSEATDPAT
jgi:RNA polymerase sigma-70 factor, ECF subfamily